MQEWFQALFAGWFGAAGNDIGLLVSIVVKIVIYPCAADSEPWLSDLLRA